MSRVVAVFLVATFSMSWGYASTLRGSAYRGDFSPSYQENVYGLGVDFDLTTDLVASLDYAHTDRNYREMAQLFKNSWTLGGVYKLPKWKTYLEFSAMTSDSDLIGALNQYSITPHTTKWEAFDLGLGFIYSNYSTGDIFSLSPQILYFHSSGWTWGHASWLFDDGGWHYAGRVFVRHQYGNWIPELSYAAGETREDVGVLDSFQSYGGSLKYIWGKASLGLSMERYQGDLRQGWQGGVQAACPF